MQEEYKPNEVNKERAEKVEGVDTSSEVISAELEINDVLAPYFKNAETGKYAKSDRAYIKIKLDSVEEFDELDTLFGIIGIDPWSDKEHLLYTIDNHYDIENLVERGIVDGLLPEAIDVEEEIEMYSRASSLPQLRPIPELFKGTRENTFEKYEKLLENEQNKEESLQEGSTNDSVTFLYSRYKKKYRRESGGAVYRKSTQGEEIEITREEENLLIEKARAGDPKAREEVLTMNMGLVYFVALNIGRRFPMINLADLVQESLIAMNHCIASHDPTAETRYPMIQLHH